jgi:hypothetical protein
VILANYWFASGELLVCIWFASGLHLVNYWFASGLHLVIPGICQDKVNRQGDLLIEMFAD